LGPDGFRHPPPENRIRYSICQNLLKCQEKNLKIMPTLFEKPGGAHGCAPLHTNLGHSLPEGWRWVRLDTLGKFEAGGTPPKERNDYWGGLIPFVTGADITDLHISAYNARAFLSEQGLASGKTVVCYPSTVLIVTRTRVGRAGICNELMGASQDITAFICSTDLLPEFLCRYLHSISEYLIDNCRGATIQGLTRDFICNLGIPLPPLPEQKRIAMILNEQMAMVERARKAAEEELETIKAIPAALLRQAFEGKL
jgi:restriction endonuclease S subunit